MSEGAYCPQCGFHKDNECPGHDEPKMNLSIQDYRILAALGDSGGFTTRDVGRHAIARTDRRGSALLRQQLLKLQAAGLVGKLDDQKPTAWVRTEAGTTALQANPHLNI